MPPRHAVYGDYRVTDGHWLCKASMAAQAVQGSLNEPYRGFVSNRYQYKETAAFRENLRFLRRPVNRCQIGTNFAATCEVVMKGKKDEQQKHILEFF